MFHIREKAKHAAKRAGLLTGGLLFCAVGTGFLTVAAWLALVPMIGMPVAATTIAALYLGVGFVLIGVAAQSSRSARREEPRATPQSSEGPPIIQAFMYGLQAGAQADQKRHASARS